MYIIAIEPLENNLHLIESQSHRKSVWMDGYIEIPSRLVEEVTATGGYCDLIIEDGVLVGVTPTEKPVVPEPEPTQLDIIEAQVTYTAMMTNTLVGV